MEVTIFAAIAGFFTGMAICAIVYICIDFAVDLYDNLTR